MERAPSLSHSARPCRRTSRRVCLLAYGFVAQCEDYEVCRPFLEWTAARVWCGLDPAGALVLRASDGRTAVVRLGAVTRPPLVTWVTAPWSDGITLEVEAVARAS